MSIAITQGTKTLKELNMNSTACNAGNHKAGVTTLSGSN